MQLSSRISGVQSLKMEEKQRAEMADKMDQLELEDSSAQDSSWLNVVCFSCQRQIQKGPCADVLKTYLSGNDLGWTRWMLRTGILTSFSWLQWSYKRQVSCQHAQKHRGNAFWMLHSFLIETYSTCIIWCKEGPRQMVASIHKSRMASPVKATC